MNDEAKDLLRTCAQNLLNAVNCQENMQSQTSIGSGNQTTNERRTQGYTPNSYTIKF